MSEDAHAPLTRLQELLADQALFGLPDQERLELQDLLTAASLENAEAFERTAAVLQLATLTAEEPLPTALAEKLLQTGRAMASDNTLDNLATPGEQPRPSLPVVSRGREFFAWAAAAASIIAALFFANRHGDSLTAELSPATLRQQLLEQPAGLTQVAWSAGNDSTGSLASGDVVWDNQRQQGVMRFRNLPANDPTKSQYQLWIFDTAQDERYPIDGGVFDIPAEGGEVLVPIQAKLAVVKPTLFAITIEPPGGVVVSSRERLPLLAKVP